MTVRIRLARFGSKNHPFYRIRVADSRSPRDGKFIETVGTYNPEPHPRDESKHVMLNTERIKYWLAVGAQPTDTVHRILALAGVLPPLPTPPPGPHHGMTRKEITELEKKK
eukprot:TRINITY_DN4731_c1_g1_i1.p1 TRINITY_DN4731_c1_g1~~TRINITY_DN4731_c1_g1_i1.p1  ORF type:complete len:111 (-),score=21.57 TRINITY_DN4731_c1_g1_i1:319-651(-)